MSGPLQYGFPEGRKEKVDIPLPGLLRQGNIFPPAVNTLITIILVEVRV